MLTNWTFIRSKLADGRVHSKIFVKHPTPSGDETYMAGEVIMPATDWTQFIGLIRKSASENLEVTVEIMAGPPLDTLAEVPPVAPQGAPLPPGVEVVTPVEMPALNSVGPSPVPVVPPKPASKFTPASEKAEEKGGPKNETIRSDKAGTN